MLRVVRKVKQEEGGEREGEREGEGEGEREGEREREVGWRRWTEIDKGHSVLWGAEGELCLEPRNLEAQCTLPSILLTVCIRLLRAALWCWQPLAFRTVVPRRLQCTVSEPFNTSGLAVLPDILTTTGRYFIAIFPLQILTVLLTMEGLFVFFSLNCAADGGGCSLYSGDGMHPSYSFNRT